MQLYDISPRIVGSELNGQPVLVIEDLTKDGELRYTLDGRMPSASSTLCKNPVNLVDSARIRCILFRRGQPVARSEVTLHTHFALGRIPILTQPYCLRHTGGGQEALTNGILDSEYFEDGHWQGFEGQDLDATIDLGQAISMVHIQIRFLQNIASWIWLPTNVEALVSMDGHSFHRIGSMRAGMPTCREGPFVESFDFPLDEHQARYVRIRVQNMGRCPA